jgi:phosphomethylpyrimidine synthase
MNGETEANEPVRVYDTSGAWGDPSVTIDPAQGLPPLRRDWILKRGDVDEIEGRVVRPIDDGYLSDKHAPSLKRQRSLELCASPETVRPAGHPVTQLW